MIAGRTQRETPRFNEIVRNGWTGLRLRWTGRRRQWAKERNGLEAEAAFISGLLRPWTGVLPGNGIGGCFLPSAKSGIDDIGLRLRRDRECGQ